MMVIPQKLLRSSEYTFVCLIEDDFHNVRLSKHLFIGGHITCLAKVAQTGEQ